MANVEVKIRARNLRRNGSSFKEISKTLGISKSTAGLWCQDIVLTKKQVHEIEARSLIKSSKGRMKGALANKQRRLDIIKGFKKDGLRHVGDLGERELLLIGSALYWAEGAKTSSKFIFINSSPDMIKVMYSFLTKVMLVKKREIRIGVQINKVHTHRIGIVLNFWSKLLNLPPAQFSKPYFVNVKPKKVYENMDTYYGIVRLKVIKSSSLQYRILGLIDAIIAGAK